MADLFDARLKMRLQESGGNSGQWGTLLNQTVTNIASVFGYGTHQLSNNADATLTLSDDGASIDALKASYLKITSAVSLTATRTLTFAPNTLNQVKYIENATSGSQSITISQGSGANVTIENGATKVVYFDGAGSGAAVVDALANIDQGTAEFDTIKVATIQANDGTASSTIANSTGVMTIASSVLTTTDINGGTADSLVIGASTAAAGSFTTLTASGNATFSGTVGIGAAPHATAPLNLTTTNQHIRLNNGSELGIISLDSDGKLDFWAHGDGETIGFRTGTGSGTVAMSVVGTNVGIATTDVKEKLSVSGAAVFDGNHATGTNAYGAAQGVMIHAASSSGFITAVSNGANDVDLQLRALNGGSANSNQLVLDSEGGVGIGTSSPSTYDSRANNLVVGDSGDAGITIFSGSTSNARLQFAPSGDTGLNNGLIDYDNNNDSMTFATAGSDRMRIDQYGTLAVGTTDTHTWSTFDGRFRIGARGIVATTTTSTQIGHNWYYNGGYKYIGADYASRIIQSSGYVSVETATNGSADGAITFDEKFKIRNDGKVDIKLGTDAYGTFADNIGEVGSGNFCLQVANSSGSALKPLGFRAEDIRFATSSAERLRIDQNGAVTKPYQPAFSVSKNSDQSNIAVSTDVTVTWPTEIFDIGSNFASNTFTAPVTGKYQLNLILRLDNVDSAAAYYIVSFFTSNRNYRFIAQPGFTSDLVYNGYSASVLADMDANDTVYVTINQGTGASQTDVRGDVSYQNFSGYLVA